MSEHISADHGLFLLALAPDDPERQRALAHAEHCETCRLLLEESAQLLTLIDASEGEAPALDAQLAARVHAAVHGRQAQSRSRGPAVWLLWLGAGLTLVLGWLASQHSGAHALHSDASCFMFEQGLAAVSFGLGYLRSRRLGARMPVLESAAFAMGGALAGQALLLLRCDAAGAAQHILMSHVLGVACAAVAGGLVPRLSRPDRVH